jgi:hypothetical protein
LADEKFVSASYPWYVGVGQDVELFGPDLSIRSGASVGTYVTVVYESHSDKTSVSWVVKEEESGEINAIAQQVPATIEMRASDISPLGRSVTFVSSSLIATTTVRMSKIGNVYYGMPTSTLIADYGMGGGQWRMAIGTSKRYDYTENVLIIGGHLVVEPGLAIVPSFNNYNWGGGQWRMATGVAFTFTQMDSGSIIGGQLVTEGGTIQ